MTEASAFERGTVLVTGGAGYVGAHCCKALAAVGLTPIVYDDLSTGRRDFVQWGPLIIGDVRDRQALLRALEAHRPIAVFHFAALALVGESVSDPGRYWDVNVGGALALLEAMRLSDVKRLVFSSTCAVYGEPAARTLSEDHPTLPVNPYGASKLAAERMMDDFDRAHGLKSVRLRYFNAAGADPEGCVGEDREIETHLIPRILNAVIDRQSAIEVFGVDYPTPDGTAVRDYVHVCDLARAHVKALDYLMAGGQTRAFNLGCGLGASVFEVIGAAERVVGNSVKKSVQARRAGDPAYLVADPQRAARELQWTAQRSDLGSILADAWNWHQNRFARQAS